MKLCSEWVSCADGWACREAASGWEMGRAGTRSGDAAGWFFRVSIRFRLAWMGELVYTSVGLIFWSNSFRTAERFRHPIRRALEASTMSRRLSQHRWMVTVLASVA